MEKKNEYMHPVSQLLELGDSWKNQYKIDYSELEITRNHIPELIQLATDSYYLRGCSDDTQIWGTIHACRALGQLKAAEAVVPLVEMLKMIDENDEDWMIDDMPSVFESIGREATPALMRYTSNLNNTLYARVTAHNSLVKIAMSDESFKGDCIKFLRSCLGNYINEDSTMNAHFIDGLIDLKDIDSASLIQKAFDQECVDEMFMGDWEDCQIRLGLKQERTAPRKNMLEKLNFPYKFVPSQNIIEQKRQSRNRKEKVRKQNKQARKMRKRCR